MSHHRMFDRLVSVLCLFGIIGALIWMDERVRDRFFWLVDEAARSDGFTTHAGSMASALVRAANDHSLSGAPILVFAGVAILLFAFMFKT